jgi:hypothetical protein
MIPTSLRLIYHFPYPFPKITWFTGESPQNICRQLVPELHGPVYKGNKNVDGQQLARAALRRV